MRRGFGLIGVLLTVVVLVIVGAIAYNVGWSDGVNTHLPAATQGGSVAPGPYYYGYGFHPFFAGFGILWFLFILFGIFFLLRLVFFGRMWRGGGWGHRGWGYGPGGPGIPPGIDERMQEWHKQAHGEQAPPGSTPPPPPPDTRSV